MQVLSGAARGRAAAMALSIHFLWPAWALAGGPILDFDFPRTIECSELGQEDSGPRIIRCVIPLSVRLLGGDIDAVHEIRVEIGDCDRRLRVHDFSPDTRLESDVAGTVEWTKTTESSKSLSGSLGGEAPVPLGEVVAHVTPSVSGGVTKREVITEHLQRLPPRQVVVASGTVNSGHGVFFNLRPSPQGSLEGMHALTIDLAAPPSWRGDALYVRVEAAGEEKFLWLTQEKRWAQKHGKVAIYLAGDEKAQAAAEKYARR